MGQPRRAGRRTSRPPGPLARQRGHGRLHHRERRHGRPPPQRRPSHRVLSRRPGTPTDARNRGATVHRQGPSGARPRTPAHLAEPHFRLKRSRSTKHPKPNSLSGLPDFDMRIVDSWCPRVGRRNPRSPGLRALARPVVRIAGFDGDRWHPHDGIPAAGRWLHPPYGRVPAHPKPPRGPGGVRRRPESLSFHSLCPSAHPRACAPRLCAPWVSPPRRHHEHDPA